jgi:3-methyladenine DNA glycosylase AlkD
MNSIDVKTKVGEQHHSRLEETMSNTYIDRLEALLRSHADEAKAAPMQAYMKNLFPFLGIKNPERMALTKAYIKEHGVPEGNELHSTVRKLWQLPEREFHYTAMVLLEKKVKGAEASRIDLIEELITTQSWWDTVDLLASHLAGKHFTLYPELIPAYTRRWIESDNMWLQRSAILFQLSYKQRTDVSLLFDFIHRTADSKEFFIRKAIGWALREYSKTDEAAVRRFVAETKLSPLSSREALKVVNKKANAVEV